MHLDDKHQQCQRCRGSKCDGKFTLCKECKDWPEKDKQKLYRSIQSAGTKSHKRSASSDITPRKAARSKYSSEKLASQNEQYRQILSGTGIIPTSTSTITSERTSVTRNLFPKDAKFEQITLTATGTNTLRDGEKEGGLQSPPPPPPLPPDTSVEEIRTVTMLSDAQSQNLTDLTLSDHSLNQEVSQPLLVQPPSEPAQLPFHERNIITDAGTNTFEFSGQSSSKITPSTLSQYIPAEPTKPSGQAFGKTPVNAPDVSVSEHVNSQTFPTFSYQGGFQPNMGNYGYPQPQQQNRFGPYPSQPFLGGWTGPVEHYRTNWSQPSNLAYQDQSQHLLSSQMMSDAIAMAIDKLQGSQTTARKDTQDLEQNRSRSPISTYAPVSVGSRKHIPSAAKGAAPLYPDKQDTVRVQVDDLGPGSELDDTDNFNLGDPYSSDDSDEEDVLNMTQQPLWAMPRHSAEDPVQPALPEASFQESDLSISELLRQGLADAEEQRDIELKFRQSRPERGDEHLFPHSACTAFLLALFKSAQDWKDPPRAKTSMLNLRKELLRSVDHKDYNTHLPPSAYITEQMHKVTMKVQGTVDNPAVERPNTYTEAMYPLVSKDNKHQSRILSTDAKIKGFLPVEKKLHGAVGPEWPFYIPTIKGKEKPISDTDLFNVIRGFQPPKKLELPMDTVRDMLYVLRTNTVLLSREEWDATGVARLIGNAYEENRPLTEQEFRMFQSLLNDRCRDIERHAGNVLTVMANLQLSQRDAVIKALKQPLKDLPQIEPLDFDILRVSALFGKKIFGAANDSKFASIARKRRAQQDARDEAAKNATRQAYTKKSYGKPFRPDNFTPRRSPRKSNPPSHYDGKETSRSGQGGYRKGRGYDRGGRGGYRGKGTNRSQSGKRDRGGALAGPSSDKK